MLGYICKYAPVEVFESMEVKMERIEPDVTNFNQAEIRMHPNICSFAKGVLEEVVRGEYEGVILTTCCDSIRRLYDVLREEFPDKFIYMLDTPRITKDAGITLYKQRIRAMIREYEAFSGKRFDEEKFTAYLKEKEEEQQYAVKDRTVNIGIIGARANDSIKKILKENGANVAFDLTCTGLGRKIICDEADVMAGYAGGLLSQFPCMRMEQASNRDELIRRCAGSVDGIIYHTVQFCDNYAYEYAWLKNWLDRPMLLLETDYTRQSSGQVRTRIEAFLESLTAERHRPEKQRRSDGTMYVMGIDSGSTSTNAVIMDQDRKIRAFSVVRTGAKSGVSADRVLKDVLEKAGLVREDISWIVSTGYGRVSIEFADENVTEISCHGKGAHYFNPEIRTILDIGGQDSKAIRLSETGEVKDFVMNDKCAAGTGRFLEMIARTLEVSLDELGTIALTSKEKIGSELYICEEPEIVGAAGAALYALEKYGV